MIVQLSPFDLGLAALLVIALAWVSRRLQLKIGGRLLLSSVRTVIQLSLIGFVLKLNLNFSRFGTKNSNRERAQRSQRNFRCDFCVPCVLLQSIEVVLWDV